MKVLLDTHAFLWWDNDPAKLSPLVLAWCQDKANTLILSVASVWEIQIKRDLGKLRLPLPLLDVVASQQKTNNLRVLPVSLAHVLALEALPLYHKDPF